MVKKQITIGVLGIQGAILEHVSMMQTVLQNHKYKTNVVIIRHKTDLTTVDGLIIPGGESTTISKFIQRRGLHEIIYNRVKELSLSVMGTCAGCVLVASELIGNSKDISLLCLMDMTVERNAFGRQRESFEQRLTIHNVSDNFPAVFIRAPLILKTWGNCRVLSSVDDGIVMCQQDNVLGLSFHPELTHNTSIHTYFLHLIEQYK